MVMSNRSLAHGRYSPKEKPAKAQDLLPSPLTTHASAANAKAGAARASVEGTPFAGGVTPKTGNCMRQSGRGEILSTPRSPIGDVGLLVTFNPALFLPAQIRSLGEVLPVHGLDSTPR